MAWQTYIFSSLGDPPDPYFQIVSVRTGRRVPFPISGDDPGAWEADGGRWDGTLESDLGIYKAGTEMDYTRYRRLHPKVTFQDYQELIININYGWGSCGAWHHFWFGKGDCLHRERELAFWYPVGAPYERQNVRAYRWVHTSAKKEGGVEIPVVGDVSIGATGSGSTFIPWDPEKPPPEPHADDFHPDHGNPPGGGRNGPFTGYGPMSGRPQIIKNLEEVVKTAIGGPSGEGDQNAQNFSRAFLAGYIAMQLASAESKAMNYRRDKRQEPLI
jgi:hypothetical protein